MAAANSTTTMTAAMVPHGVGRFVTTEDRVFRVALLFLPLTIDRPDLVGTVTRTALAFSGRRV